MLTREKIDEVLKMFDTANLTSEVGRNLIIDKIMELSKSNKYDIPTYGIPCRGTSNTNVSIDVDDTYNKSQDK